MGLDATPLQPADIDHARRGYRGFVVLFLVAACDGFDAAR